jgi:hypothetical protein
VLCVALFGYKKMAIDYSGKYATDRLVYTEEYGFTMLITYHPRYQTEISKGFAIVHIPLKTVFSETMWAKRGGGDTADAKNLLDAYSALQLTQNDLVRSLGEQLFGPFAPQPLAGLARSFPVGKYGDYYIIDGENYGSEKATASKETQNQTQPARADTSVEKKEPKSFFDPFHLLDGEQKDYDRFISKYGPLYEITEEDFKNRHVENEMDQVIHARVKNMECDIYRINADTAYFVLVGATITGAIGVPEIDAMFGMTKARFAEAYGNIGEDVDGGIAVSDDGHSVLLYFSPEGQPDATVDRITFSHNID